MGLDVYAKGLNEKSCFCCGYLTYENFIMELIKTAYGERCYRIFRNSLISQKPFSDEDEKYWNARCNDDLEILIWHSDCDGKFTPAECRKIYNAIKDLHMDMQGHNYGVMEPYNMLDHWKAIFKHCADKRVNLYYR